MAEMINPESFQDHPDSVVHMEMRRIINGTYAEQPVDFNHAGLMAISRILGRQTLDESVVVDIGSSSGEAVARAALALNTDARIVCVEPHPEAAELHHFLEEDHQHRVDFIQGIGENLPLKTSSVQAVSLHNVIFRGDAERLLAEAKRVVAPNGIIVVSSNAQGHARWRHQFERQVAECVSDMTGQLFRIPTPPAEGSYLEDLPALFERVGQLEEVPDLYVSQDTEAIITLGERLENYLDSIKYASINTDLPTRYNNIWRTVVDSWLRAAIELRITEMEEELRRQGLVREPFFADIIRRGMYVLLNKK